MNQIRHFSPSQLIALTFAGLILAGALLLMLPFAGREGAGLSFVDALFTATSASCVTGLVVVDTGTYFSTFGQLVIIALIQLGGLGLVLFATLFSVLLRKKIDLQSRLNIQASLNQDELDGVVRMSLRIAKYTAVIEGFFGTVLAFRFWPQYGLRGIYYGYWHAVSAFCNAGFDLFGHYQSLTAFVGDPVVNLSIGLLIILGGLGFAVMRDVLQKRNFQRLKLHSKMVLTVTGLLIGIGMIGFALLESRNPATLGSLSTGDAFWASFMQSVSPRTAGFNSVDLNSLRVPTMIFTIFLMFIGASPASTGGGIKTTTFFVLLSGIYSAATNHSERAFHSAIPKDAFRKASVISMLAVFLVMTASYLMLIFDPQLSLRDVLFEMISAFSTSGLSTGITPQLSAPSRILSILMMYIGRLGPLTVASLWYFTIGERVRYPEGTIAIG